MIMQNLNPVVAYTAGVWDLFHIGHLNMLRRASGHGDCLIVGVATDEAATAYKRKPVIPFEQRCAIVRAIRYVDMVVPVYELGSVEPMIKYGVAVRVTGDDFGQYPEQKVAAIRMAELGIRLVTLYRTPFVSTTLIRQRIGETNED